ncbi:oligosaccharide flippase family protein [Cellulomonas sp. DKR-3]|uniref:Oligosaccharide flippase family protein n=1 Tax=Cellulomonas fulva TaxID=2835530 RepID=A0ABS5TUU1_9CELL|nr:oligosaccharide flippase family protein [Cellulomonas fulva]MBT0992903.1 oligosaccharide flippase family protein [Cellulomonas fulva]
MTSTRPSDVREARALAGASGLTFIGATFSAVAGFLLTIALGRTLGAHGTGVVVQVIGLFSIGVAIAKLGLDTCAVWLLPRLRREDPHEIRPVLALILGSGFVAGLALAAAAVVAVTAWTGLDPDLRRALLATAWLLPFAVSATIGLAATRGLSSVRPFVLIGSVAVPGVRPLLVLLVAAVGAGSVLASALWAAPLAVALLPVLLVLRRRVRELERRDGVVGADEHVPRRTTSRATRRSITRFSAPRAFASVVELAQQWVDVVVVGAIAGAGAAGVYGAATRLVSAGTIPSTSMRVVVAPLFSDALHRGDTAAAQRVYARTTAWIVLLSAPVYALLALFPQAVLGVVGPAFRSGGEALVWLCAGASVAFLTGNVQSVLLMSGRSAWVAVNKVVVLVVLLAGLLVLVPDGGIAGAAMAWAAATCVDAVLASVQVRRLVGIRLEAGRVALALAAGGATFAAGGVIGRAVLGDSLGGLAVALGAGLALAAPAVVVLRRPLEVDGLVGLARRGSPRVPAPPTPVAEPARPSGEDQ